MATAPVFHEPGKGTVINAFGLDHIIKVFGDETGGAYSVLEVIVPPGAGTPPHVHHREDELFLVLEGEVEFIADGQSRRAKPGTWALLPRDLPHHFRNPGESEARLHITIVPGGFERFFEEVNALAEGGGPPDPAAVAAMAAEKFGLDFLP